MKTMLHTFLCILLVCAIVIGVPLCLSGCSESNGEKVPAPSSRFVEVKEELICPDYSLGTDSFMSDGSKEADIYYYRYLVDRVSRKVYIEIRETGQHSSGVEWIECPDENGNHMVYTGELPQ